MDLLSMSVFVFHAPFWLFSFRFALFWYTIFFTSFCFLLEAHYFFLMIERGRAWIGGQDRILRCKGGENIIRIYYNERKYWFSKKEKYLEDERKSIKTCFFCLLIFLHTSIIHKKAIYINYKFFIIDAFKTWGK